ncbi:MAG TPA: YceI family protein [Gemmatimonadaceae bacterium]
MSRHLSNVIRLSLVVLMAFVPGGTRAQSATFASFSGKTGLPVQRLDVDWPHSAIEFSVRFMGLSTVRGAFSEFGGTIMVDTVDARRSSVSVVIQTKSINTNVESRDKDLRSENFFDAGKYPVILFRSERIDRTKTGFVARGPLTIHGVTKQVAIPFRQTHALMGDAWGNKRMGFLGKLSLNRKDYGILGTKFWNSEFDPGRMSISDNVDIELNIEAEASQVEKWTTPRGDSLLKVAAGQGIAKTLEEFRAAAADTASPLRKASAQMLNAAATKLMHRGDFAGAAETYKLLAELNPSKDWAYAGLGEAYLMSGKKTEATDSFRKALAIDSLNTVASEYLRHIERSTASR